MKYITLLISFFAINCAICQQQMQSDADGAYIESIVEVDTTKDALFVVAKQWLFRAYKSGKHVLQMEDKDAGIIAAKASTGRLTYNNVGVKVDAGIFRYHLTLRVKQGKAKIRIDHIFYEAGEMGVSGGANYVDQYPDNWPKSLKKYNEKNWNKMKGQALEEFQLIITDFETFVKSGAKSDGW